MQNICKYCKSNFNGYSKAMYCNRKCYSLDRIENWKQWELPKVDKFDEIMDGILLSDGSLNLATDKYSPSFAFGQGTGHKEYCDYFAKLLNFDASYVKYYQSFNKMTNKHYDTYKFQTTISRDLMPFYKRWYPEGKKIIPDDFKVTPITMLHEYLGDGCLSEYDANKSKNHYYKIELSTHSFDKDRLIELIVKPLNKLGIMANYYYGRKSTKSNNINTVVINRQNSIIDFLKYISPNPISCYDYKFRILGN